MEGTGRLHKDRLERHARQGVAQARPKTAVRGGPTASVPSLGKASMASLAPRNLVIPAPLPTHGSGALVLR